MRISDWSSDLCSSDLGVDVRRDGPRARPQRQRRKGEQPGAGADIGDMTRGHALPRQPVEHRQAAGGRVVSAGAERLAGVDKKGRRASRNGVGVVARMDKEAPRSEEHTSELQSLMRISYVVFCLKKKKERKLSNKNKNTLTISLYNVAIN